MFTRRALTGAIALTPLVVALAVGGLGATALERAVPAGTAATSTTSTAATTTTTTTTTATAAGPAESERSPGRAFQAVTPSDDSELPLSQGDFADPFVLTTAAGPVAYATNAGGKNVPMGYFDDGRFVYADALPEIASWSVPGAVWAPSVAYIGGRYVLYYTTREAVSGRQCISAATSDVATGPFRDDSTGPLVCDVSRGGSIDPSPVQDATGAWYLLWKSDGNCCGIATTIYAHRLDSSGLRVTGSATALITADQSWEGGVVEAPSMVAVGGDWYLFYSGNDWNSAGYAVGYAVCESPAGPCRKADTGPLLTSTATRIGPGGAEVVAAAPRGVTVLAFHAWGNGAVGYERGGARQLYLQSVVIADGRVSLRDPSA